MSRSRRKQKLLRKQNTPLKRLARFLLRYTSPRYTITTKLLGETPLEATERLRSKKGWEHTIPLAYAGRLDPMATGKLLILIGDECKVQTKYHSLDKEYVVELLFGIRSDSGDVLGLVEQCTQTVITREAIESAFAKLQGPVTLPYPHFSSKTVQGKPLHMWAVEKRLDEIDIPEKTSTIHKLTLNSMKTISNEKLLRTVRGKIESIPPVTDPRKHIGADFRRADVRASWNTIESNGIEKYHVLTFTCTASSGTYMRSLAELIARELGTCGLALSIHRTTIGKYLPVTKSIGFWTKKY